MIPRNIKETKANSMIISLFKQYISTINLKKCILINSIISSRAKPSSFSQEEVPTSTKSNSVTDTDTIADTNKISIIDSNSITNTDINDHTITITNAISNPETSVTINREYEDIIVKEIISQRLKAVTTLIKCYERLKYRFLIKAILFKRKTHYLITSSMTEAKNLALEIYSDDAKPTLYKSEYCPILQENVIYIPRTHKHNLISKIRFKVDGKFVIDPKFTTELEGNNQFYNVINFKKMQKEETTEQLESRKTISLVIASLAREYSEKMQKVSSFEKLPKAKKGISRFDTKFKSMAVLNVNGDVKPILKSRPVKRIPSTRKIGFGNVKYSY